MRVNELATVMLKLDRKYAKIDELDRKRKPWQVELDRTNGHYGNCIIATIAGVVVAGFALLAAFALSDDELGALLGVAGGVLGLVLLVAGASQYTTYRRRQVEVDVTAREHLAELDRAVEAVRDEMAPMSLLFPTSCRNAEANAYMLQMLLCGRARSFNDAVSLWEMYAHRRHLEQLEQARVEEARRQTAAMQAAAAAEISQAADLHRQTRELREQTELMRRQLDSRR